MSKVSISSSISLYYEEFGDRSNPTIVLIRGTGADSSRWMPQVAVYKQDFHVLIFDNRGAGKSDTPKGPYTVGEMADDTIRLLDKLNIQSCNLSGSSLGGAIALHAALEHPDRVRSLQMHSSWLKTHGYMEFSLNLLKKYLLSGGIDFYYEAALPLLFSPKFLSSDYERLKSILAHFRANAATHDGLLGQIEANISHDLLDSAKNLQIPTLVTVGEADYLLPVSASEEIVDTIKGAELVVFKNGPHLVTMESPTEFNEVTLRWMKKNCKH